MSEGGKRKPRPPLRIHLNWPPGSPEPPAAAPAPDWKEPAKYQREIAKWIVGGVMAAVIAILAGSSLTRLGSLDFETHALRLSLAIAGAATGLAGIGWFLYLALKVLSVEAGGINNLEGDRDAEWTAIVQRINHLFAFELADDAGNARQVEQLVKARRDGELTASDLDILKRINAALGFLFVQHRYKRMMDSLPFVGLAAIVGFGLYAWAANPGDQPVPERPGLLLKLTR